MPRHKYSTAIPKQDQVSSAIPEVDLFDTVPTFHNLCGRRTTHKMCGCSKCKT